MDVRKFWARECQCHLLAVQCHLLAEPMVGLSVSILFCKWRKVTNMESS